MHPTDLPSTFIMAGRPYVNSRHFTMRPGDLLSTSFNFPCSQIFSFKFPYGARPFFSFHEVTCSQVTFFKCLLNFPAVRKCFAPISVWPGDLASTFHASGRFSVNFVHLSVRPVYFPTTSMIFLCCQSSVKFVCQLSVPSGDPSSTFVKYPCGQMTFHQHSVKLLEYLSSSVNFPCSKETFHQISSSLGMAGRHSVNFHLHSVQLGDLLSIFCAASRPSVKFLYSVKAFRQLSSTSRMVGMQSINFHQLSVRLEDLPSTFIDFLYGRETFWQLPQTFRATTRPTVNFLCGSIYSVKFSHGLETFRQAK